MQEKVDLHTHSTASDGLYEPSDLLRQASEAGLTVLALTDHDSTNGIDEAKQAAKQLGIELIPGIEINTSINGKEVHVLGYFIEYERAAFQKTLHFLRDVREKRGERIVQKLNDLGVHIAWERVRELAQGSVGRPHVARALVEAGYAQSVADAFDKYIGSRCPAYVPRYQLSSENAIRLIVSANGVPVIAHPYYYPGLTLLKERLPEFCALGLAGLETYYGPYTQEQEQEVRALADAYKLIPTGGSDYHGPGIHPTPLGGRPVPHAAVEQLKTAYAERRRETPPTFELPEQG